MSDRKNSAVTPRRALTAIAILLSFAFVASWTSLPARAGGSAAAQAASVAPAPRHLIAPRTGIVYPLRLPPATLSLARHSRRLRLTDRQLAAQAAREPALPEIPSLATFALTAMPTLYTNFAGLGFPDSQCGPGCEPPDGQLAAGPNNIIEVTNIVMRIYDKSGNVISTTNLNTLFGVDPSIFSSDPRVAYDTISGRWFISFLVLDTDDITTAQNGFFELAVSISSDPTAGFYTYSAETTLDFPDQPSLGFNDDKVAQGGNSFSCSPDCEDGPYEGNEFIVWNKSELLAGDAGADFDFYGPGLDTSDFPILPAKSRSSTSTLYMVSAFATELNIWKVINVPGVGDGSIAGFTTAAITNIAIPPVAPQKGNSAAPIDTGDARLLDAVFRNSELWTSGGAACEPSGDSKMRSCLEYIEVLPTGTPVVGANFAVGTKSFYDYYPSVELDNLDNLITSFTQSSSAEFPSAYVAGRMTTDPSGTLETPVLIQAGSASYNSPDPESGNSNALPWGDYSGAAIDPSDQTAVWVAAEYAGPTSEPTPNWGTWIAEARLQSPGATPTATGTETATATATTTSSSTASPTPTSTGSSSATASPTPTSTGSSSATASPTPTSSGSSSATASPTPTSTGSSSATATPTPTSSGSPSATASPTPTATDTATPTATATATTTQTATPTATPTPPFGTLSVSGNLKFGKVKVSSAKSKKLKVQNKGKFPLQVTIGTLAAPFSVTGAGTFNLTKKQSETVTVSFMPTTTGPTPNQVLAITSDDPKHPLHPVTASGSGK